MRRESVVGLRCTSEPAAAQHTRPSEAEESAELEVGGSSLLLRQRLIVSL